MGPLEAAPRAAADIQDPLVSIEVRRQAEIGRVQPLVERVIEVAAFGLLALPIAELRAPLIRERRQLGANVPQVLAQLAPRLPGGSGDHSRRSPMGRIGTERQTRRWTVLAQRIGPPLVRTAWPCADRACRAGRRPARSPRAR